jgi:capsular polysaccharide transport system permease protein
MRTRSCWEIQQAVVFALFLRELKARFGKFKFGYAWMFVEPIAHIIIMTLIFSYARNRAMFGIDFPVFLVTGVVPFLMFKNIALRVMDGAEANRALFIYRQIKPMDAFIARALLDAFLAMVVYAVLLIGMTWIGMDVPFRDPFTVMLVIALLILQGMGLGMIFCVITYYMPQAATIIRLIMFPLYLLSGVIFPVAMLPREFLPILLWNPLLHAVEWMRGAFFTQYHVLYQVSPLFVVMTALVLIFFGLALYRNNRYELVTQ